MRTDLENFLELLDDKMQFKKHTWTSLLLTYCLTDLGKSLHFCKTQGLLHHLGTSRINIYSSLELVKSGKVALSACIFTKETSNIMSEE